MSRLRRMTARESHEPRLVALVEGIPAGLPLLTSDIDEDLARRQRGYGRGGRMKVETDRVEFGGGGRGGEALGSPIAMTIVNRDHQNWHDRMSPGPLPAPAEPLTRPRPGHDDLAGALKHDRKDLRDASRGSQVHDAIHDAEARRFTRPTNRAGGLEDGVTNGEAVLCRAAMGPIATLKRALPGVDVRTKEPFDAAHERSDICAVAAASIVGEAMVAITLCDALLETFGGDSLREPTRNVDSYRAQVEAF